MDDFTKKWQDFHEGNLSKKEAVEFIHFLESSSGKNSFQQLLTNTWTEQEEVKPTTEIPLSSSGFEKNSQSYKENKFSTSKVSTVNSIFKFAACLLALLLVLKIFNFLPGLAKSEVKEEQKIIWISKSNPKGIKSKILLPDSSWVYLNAGSTIKYANNFAVNRHVILEGEAFFEVFNDREYPFTVEASHIETQVLGTSFNINSVFPESVEVGLATGSLKILNAGSGKELLLSPGEASKIGVGTIEMEKYKVPQESIAPWKEGILHFNNENFNRVITKLENWYGVKITVEGKLPDEKCNGIFQKNTYLTNVLKVLGHAVDFTYEIDEHQVTINTINYE